MKPDPKMLYEICPGCLGVTSGVICPVCLGVKFKPTGVQKGLIGQLHSAYQDMQLTIAAIIKQSGGSLTIDDSVVKLLPRNTTINSVHDHNGTTLTIEESNDTRSSQVDP